MHDDQSKKEEFQSKHETARTTPKRLNAKARTLALIDLSRQYPAEFRRYYTIRKREVFAQAGVPLTRRPTRHMNDGTGFCQADGRIWPCPYIRRRQARNE